jgi:hypothetical protein
VSPWVRPMTSLTIDELFFLGFPLVVSGGLRNNANLDVATSPHDNGVTSKQ